MDTQPTKIWVVTDQTFSTIEYELIKLNKREAIVKSYGAKRKIPIHNGVSVHHTKEDAMATLKINIEKAIKAIDEKRIKLLQVLAKPELTLHVEEAAGFAFAGKLILD